MIVFVIECMGKCGRIEHADVFKTKYVRLGEVLPEIRHHSPPPIVIFNFPCVEVGCGCDGAIQDILYGFPPKVRERTPCGIRRIRQKNRIAGASNIAAATTAALYRMLVIVTPSTPNLGATAGTKLWSGP